MDQDPLVLLLGQGTDGQIHGQLKGLEYPAPVGLAGCQAVQDALLTDKLLDPMAGVSNLGLAVAHQILREAPGGPRDEDVIKELPRLTVALLHKVLLVDLKPAD